MSRVWQPCLAAADTLAASGANLLDTTLADARTLVLARTSAA
ncbi:hypothetical protein EMGBS1_07390, partial [Chloroflexota bacterium]